MAEAISLAASVIAIAEMTWYSCKTLNDTIKRFRNAPEKLRNLLGDLGTLIQLLQSLRGHLEPSMSAGHPSAHEALKPAMQGCQQLCDEFTKRLAELTSHSNEEYIGRRDRLRFHFNDTEIMLLKERLVQYKLTFDIALNVASLRTTSQNKQTTEHMETKFVASLGSLTGKIESLQTDMQPLSTPRTCTCSQDKPDGKVRIAVTAFEQYANVLKQCLKVHTPVLEVTGKPRGTTFKWIRELDDAKRFAGNIGDVGSGGPAVYVEQTEAKVSSRQYFG
ncbi:hypothetical protein VMCG_02966 [Cytospora schulzeri]|uniref:Azaphilone pigments biosynthesis cluster protein L N-terminal domain-containing protein n=1 Tax=Cytospora schulzeri TaxID=448051 RepID=A0A423WZQ7_9PEZI|nr:hypothetical protein VMCG_02966 [Valsa malicola]